MGEHTEYIRKIGRSVEASKQVNREIKSICEEIDELVKKGKAGREKRLRGKKGQ